MTNGAEEKTTLSKVKKTKMKRKKECPGSRDRFSKIIEQFRLSKDNIYVFGSDLTSLERGTVHNLCSELGLSSKSSGSGKDRCITISKTKTFKPKKVAGKGSITRKESVKEQKENIDSFTFSEESKAVLHDLFSRYPPNDADMNENKAEQSSGKKLKVGGANRDILFQKQIMTQSEIAKKVESLSSRINNSRSLKQIMEKRSKLPIASFKDVITSTMESHQVMLICGETGCGKTTQVPQFLVDHSWSKGETCKVVCSQPRRISATSVAERIASERGETLGNSVGYKIRMGGKGGRHSSLVFCTNGILLRVLVGNMSGRNELSSKRTANRDFDITHIIVDEIHERDRFSDIILTILRDTLPLYPHLRLILMSATIDAENFSMYFGGCPIINVPGFTYPVKSLYLEDALLSLITSTKNSKPEPAQGDVTVKDTFLTDGCSTAFDEAIDLALSNDNFDPLLELISSEGTAEVFNYQHSKTGETPLMVFAGKGRVSDICMLLSLGVDCQLQSHAGKRAFDYATQCNQVEAAKIIKKRMGKASTMNPNEDKKSADEDKKLPDEDKKLLDDYILNVNPELIDYVLIEQLLRRICMDSEDGAILVFLPGWDDINRTRDKLLASPFFKDPSKFDVIPLHSMVPLVEQNKAFIRPMRGCRKIVLSTNIAETSITIEDVVYVLDSGRMKEKNYDPYDNISTLESSWISKASAKQREGRAGRCQPGICYHLFSKLRWASLPDFQVPEIKRISLEEICLQVKLIDPSCKIEEFMQKTLDPPVHETISNALAVLQTAGALTPDEKLTELGEKLGALSVHPLTSKMLFLAILMNCLDPALTLACFSDNKSPFIQPMLPEGKKLAQAARLELASFYGGNGDQLALIAAFDCWTIAKEKGEATMFCTRYFLSPDGMEMLSRMRKRLKVELQRYGYLPGDTSRCSLNARNPGILHAVLFAGLYPMVGRMIPFGPNCLVETVNLNLNKVGLHHFSTNAKLSFQKFKFPPLIIFDEITRGDRGMFIGECCVIGLLPLLLLAAEIVVAPASENDNEKNDNEVGDDNDKDKMDVHDLPDSNQGEKIMGSPENVVKVVVDRWLSLESKALDVAQIYCLRERLAATILSKANHPCRVLPKHLGDTLYAIACILSNDGMSGMSVPKNDKPVQSLAIVAQPEDIGRADQATAVTQLPEDLNSLIHNQNNSLESHGQPPVSEINAHDGMSGISLPNENKPVESLAIVAQPEDIGRADQATAVTQLPEDLDSLMHNQNNSLESHAQPPVSEINVNKTAAKEKSSKKRRRLGAVDSLATVVSPTNITEKSSKKRRGLESHAQPPVSEISENDGMSGISLPNENKPVESLAIVAQPEDIGRGDQATVITQLSEDLDSLMHNQNNSLESHGQPPVSEINVNDGISGISLPNKNKPVESLCIVAQPEDIGRADQATAATQLPEDLDSLMHNQNNSQESHGQSPVSEINLNEGISGISLPDENKPVESLALVSQPEDIGRTDQAAAVTQLPEGLNSLIYNQNNSLESLAQPPVSEISVNKSAAKEKSSKKQRRLETVDSVATHNQNNSLESDGQPSVSEINLNEGISRISLPNENKPVESLAIVEQPEDIGRADQATAVTQLPEDLNSLESNAQPPVSEISVNKTAAKEKSSKKLRRLGTFDSLATEVSPTDITEKSSKKRQGLESHAQAPVSEINVNKSAAKQKSSKKESHAQAPVSEERKQQCCQTEVF